MATPTFKQLTKFHKQAEDGRITLENFRAFLRNPNKCLEDQPSLLTLAVAELIPKYTDKNGNKKKWGVVEDVSPFEFKVKDLEFISFLEKGEDYIGGEEMRKRAVGLKANLGLADAKYLLDHKAEIPAKLRGKKYIVLPGTVLRDSNSDLRVPYLGWVGGRWVLRFLWLDFDFLGRDVLARSK